MVKVTVCQECICRLEETGKRLGDWGIPGFAKRDIGLRLLSTGLHLAPGPGKLTCIVPVPSAAASHWIALTAKREVVHLDVSAGTARRIAMASELGLPIEEELSLATSRRGDFAVVATARGSVGVVIEIATGRTTMALNRGDYHVEHGLFSAAFFEHAGRTLLVHAMDWNRLDISDPRTGELLTGRGPTSYNEGEERPAHYLDYFHCGLIVSPDGTWIADNGWVWHPIGVIRTWSLQEWRTRNVWESEDGPTVREDFCRGYHWDGPCCWIDERRLAAWGLGKDDISLLPAVRIIDVVTGEERTPIIGPFGPTKPGLWSESGMLALAEQGVLAFFDGHLFVWNPTAGFSAWDISDGARVFAAEDFCPLAYNPATREFFSQQADGSCRVSKLTNE